MFHGSSFILSSVYDYVAELYSLYYDRAVYLPLE